MAPRNRPIRRSPAALLVLALLLAPTAAGAESVGRADGGDDVVGTTYLPGLPNAGRFASPPTPPPTPKPTPTTATPPAEAAPGHYVSSSATGSGDGSFDAPWTLQQALGQPAALKPGDIVWVRGGTYTGTFAADPSLGRISFSCGTNGTAAAPIVFRNYLDERVTIDGAANEVALFVQNCSHTWFWGLEVMSSAPVRTPSRAYIYCTAPNVKFINMILHDLADGIDLWTTATDAELYGSIIYHNGWDETNGGHGHGIYTQNKMPSVKKIDDNIFFSQYGMNIRAWSTNQFVDNFEFEGNIAFNGGSLSEYASRKFNFFVVGNNPKAPTRNLVARHNYTFAGNTTTTPACNAFGPNYGAVDMRLEDNHLLGQLRVTGPYTNAVIARNTILGGTALPFITGTGFRPEDYPDNVYAQDVPTTGAEVFVRPNRYEPGRANVAIYNWGGADAVNVDAGALGLSPGDRYEIIHAMDYYNDRLVRTYDGGGTIAVPMTGHTFAQAIGSTKAPVSQFPRFGARRAPGRPFPAVAARDRWRRAPQDRQPSWTAPGTSTGSCGRGWCADAFSRYAVMARADTDARASKLT
ncbi:MAG: hypothetical protein U0470_11345 [Anaerolineae bacterium]